MTLEQLESKILARAYWMRDKRAKQYVMLSNPDRWAETINLAQFRPYFRTDSKHCITLEQAKRIKERFYSICNGLR